MFYMDADKLTELKYHFEKSMEKLSCRNKPHISLAWDKLVEMHKDKPYHNLDLAYNDLKTAQDLNYSIPACLIVAAVLRYAEFDPTKIHNRVHAVNYAESFLSELFGWDNRNIKEVTDSITQSFVIISPSNVESFPARLMHDMKMARFARKAQALITDRQNAKKEFSHVSERKFYTSEDTLLKCYQNIPNLFSLEGFRVALTSIAKENIRNRISYIAEMIKYLDSSEHKKKALQM